MTILLTNEHKHLLKYNEGNVKIISDNKIVTHTAKSLVTLYDLIKTFKPVEIINNITTPSGLAIVYAENNDFIIYSDDIIIDEVIINDTLKLTLDFGTYYEKDIDTVTFKLNTNKYTKVVYKNYTIVKAIK